MLPPPVIHPVTTLKLPRYTSKRLANGMLIHTLKGGTERVLKMEMVFRAGATFESKRGVAEVTAALLTEGTFLRSSAQLAEEMESLGATFQTGGGVDTIRVKLYTLTRFFPQLLDLVMESIRQPAYDERELQTYLSNKIERLNIDLQKNEVLAYRILTESIFGQEHPYGRNLFPEHYQAINRDDLVKHQQKFITPDRGMVFMSGQFNPEDITYLEDVLSAWPNPPGNGITYDPDPKAVSQTGQIVFDGPQKHQAAIRIGRKLFPETHPDYNGLYVLNTVLGGYFGSRLMTEIREKQGMTYGIYSSVDTFSLDGCFYISTETTTDLIDRMIEAVQVEVDKLRTDLIDEAELSMVRNYLMGHLMTQIDGPFASMDFIRTMKIGDLPDEAFASLVETIQTITPSQLRDLAQTYLDLSQWATIIVH